MPSGGLFDICLYSAIRRRNAILESQILCYLKYEIIWVYTKLRIKIHNIQKFTFCISLKVLTHKYSYSIRFSETPKDLRYTSCKVKFQNKSLKQLIENCFRALVFIFR